jgi:hypothetical protein
VIAGLSLVGRPRWASRDGPAARAGPATKVHQQRGYDALAGAGRRTCPPIDLDANLQQSFQRPH